MIAHYGFTSHPDMITKLKANKESSLHDIPTWSFDISISDDIPTWCIHPLNLSTFYFTSSPDIKEVLHASPTMFYIILRQGLGCSIRAGHPVYILPTPIWHGEKVYTLSVWHMRHFGVPFWRTAFVARFLFWHGNCLWHGFCLQIYFIGYKK